jgi:hypothetical protein
LPARRRSLRRGALVIADRNALSSLAAPHFFAALATSSNRLLRGVRPLFEIEPKQKSRSAFDVDKNFKFNGDLHSAELSGSLLCLPKSATSFSAAQR